MYSACSNTYIYHIHWFTIEYKLHVQSARLPAAVGGTALEYAEGPIHRGTAGGPSQKPRCRASYGSGLIGVPLVHDENFH